MLTNLPRLLAAMILPALVLLGSGCATRPTPRGTGIDTGTPPGDTGTEGDLGQFCADREAICSSSTLATECESMGAEAATAGCGDLNLSALSCTVEASACNFEGCETEALAFYTCMCPTWAAEIEAAAAACGLTSTATCADQSAIGLTFTCILTARESSCSELEGCGVTSP